MNEIVFLNADGQAVTTSIAIADGTDVKHKNVLETIRSNIQDFQEFGPLAFETRMGKPLPQGGFAKATEVAILNESQATLLLTYMRNSEIVKGFKKHLVKSFFEIRQKLRETQAALPDFTNPAIAARAWADEVEKRMALEYQAKQDAPKVEYAEAVMAANGDVTITQAAKVLGYPCRKMKDYIRSIGWLYANSDTPMQKQVLDGSLVLRYAHYTNSSGQAVEKPYPHITARGLFKLYHRMRKENLIVRNEQLEMAA